ncbi:3733_t:CDS:2, partial [Acaulospora colombiana]
SVGKYIKVKGDLDIPKMSTFESINNPIYDLKEYEKTLESYEKDEYSYLGQYYTKNFFLNTRLAPAHPLLQYASPTNHQLPKIKNIQYNTKVVDSINKKRQNPLSIDSEICVITTDEGRAYSVKACVVGWMVDVNMRLAQEFDLFQRKPFTEGYIAIIKPKKEKSLDHCLTEEQYKIQRKL